MNTPWALPLHSDESAHRTVREVIDAKRQLVESSLQSAEQARLTTEIQALERLLHEALTPRVNTRPTQLYYEHHGSLTFLDRDTHRRFGLELNLHIAKELRRHCNHYLERSKLVGWEPGPRLEDVWNPD